MLGGHETAAGSEWSNMTLEQRSEELDRQRAMLNERLDHWMDMDAQIDERNAAAFERETELLALEKRLVERERALGLIADPGKMAGSTQDRAKALLAGIAGSKPWRGETRDHDSNKTRAEVERLAGILKQAKSARTVLAKVEAAFEDVVNRKEAETLAAARGVLYHIAEAAQLAKEQGQRLAGERKRHEEEVARAASAAMQTAFADVFGASPAAQVFFCAAACPGSYDFRELVSGAAFARSYKGYDCTQRREVDRPQDILRKTFDDAIEEAKSRLAARIRDEINKGIDAMEAARAMRAKHDDGLPSLREKFGALAQRVTTELVARQIERTNISESTRKD